MTGKKSKLCHKIGHKKKKNIGTKHMTGQQRIDVEEASKTSKPVQAHDKVK